MTTIEVLKQARARIEKGWTQGVFARDFNDKAILLRDASDKACSWCLSGAIYAASGSFHEGATKLLQKVTRTQNLATYNDAANRTKSQVLAVIDKAIEEAST